MPKFELCDQTYAISDLHLSDPQLPELENFTRDAELSKFISQLAKDPRPVSLVVVGDFMDFARLRQDHGERPPNVGGDEASSVEIARRIVRGHAQVFESMSEFVSAGNKLAILPGNHDVDLWWPGVRDVLRMSIQPNLAPGELHLCASWSLESRGVYFEHGHQCSFDNQFFREPPFVEFGGKLHLERCWGTFFLESVYNDIEYFAPWINKVHPTWLAAALAIRSLGWSRIPPVLASSTVQFFLRHGQRILAERLMSSAHQEVGDAQAAAMAAEALLGPIPKELLISTSLVEPELNEDKGGVLLGRTDRSGMLARTQEQLRRPSVKVVVMGHTHVSGIEEMANGKVSVNTGTWTGAISVAEGERPSHEELMVRVRTPTSRLTFATINASTHSVRLDEV